MLSAECNFVARISFHIPLKNIITQHIVLHLKKSTSGALICFYPASNIHASTSYPVCGNLPLPTYILPILFPVLSPKCMVSHFIHIYVHSNT